jgi:hypothetical protein
MPPAHAKLANSTIAHSQLEFFILNTSLRRLPASLS